MKRNEQKLGDILNEFVSQRQITRGYKQSSIQKFWKERMGKVINGYTKRVSLRNRTLIIELTSSTLRKELLFNQDKIIQLLNSEFEQGAVSKIQII